MLFKNDERCFKFHLVGLSSATTKEISKLITDNGGVVCRTRDPPVMTFSDSDAIRRPGEPLFHINYVRDCVRQHQLFQLVHYLIGSQGYFGCLQCIFTCDNNVCQFHYDGPRDFHPHPGSTQVESCRNVDENIKRGKSSSPGHGEKGGRKSAGNASMKRQVPEAVGSAAQTDNDGKSNDGVALRSPKNRAEPTAPLIKQEPDAVKTEETTVGPIIDDGLISDDDSSLATEDRVPLAAASGNAVPKGSSRKRKGRDKGKIRRSRAPRRPNITKAEQCKMVKYLIDNKMISQAKGLIPWEKMVKDGLTRRVPQTLNTHFRKLLLPRIDRFAMSERHLRKFQELVPRHTKLL